MEPVLSELSGVTTEGCCNGGARPSLSHWVHNTSETMALTVCVCVLCVVCFGCVCVYKHRVQVVLGVVAVLLSAISLPVLHSQCFNKIQDSALRAEASLGPLFYLGASTPSSGTFHWLWFTIYP